MSYLLFFSSSLPIRPNQITKLIQDDLKQQQHYQRMNSSSQNSVASGDVTYSSQLSLESPPGDAFSRDALGRRSMSEKHHAAMDARETGTYQRNKRAREERERERMAQAASSDALNTSGSNKMSRAEQLRKEALGPSLGMKKSSSLESLQTMVQEIQMSDEPRGPNQLRTPRGRGREESLRAAVERPESRKNTGTCWNVTWTDMELNICFSLQNLERLGCWRTEPLRMTPDSRVTGTVRCSRR